MNAERDAARQADGAEPRADARPDQGADQGADQSSDRSPEQGAATSGAVPAGAEAAASVAPAESSAEGPRERRKPYLSLDPEIPEAGEDGWVPPVQERPPPRVWVAWGRLLGGLAAVGAGGVLLKALPWVGREPLALGLMLSLGGPVLSVWGLWATLRHPEATGEDRLWALAFFLLTLAVLCGSAVANRGEFGLTL